MTGIEATPDDSNARYFHVVVIGPKDVSISLKLQLALAHSSNFLVILSVLVVSTGALVLFIFRLKILMYCLITVTL